MTSQVTSHYEYGIYHLANSTASAQKQYTQLIQTPSRVDPSTLNAIFDQLDPIRPEQLLGDWSGGFFDTDHPVANTLKEINWFGKSFTSVDHVDPVVVEVNGRRVSWGKWGFATVRETLYRGVVTTTMIYDNRPVFDHFRYVNDNLLAGIMEGKELGKDGEFYFYLKK